MDIEDDEELLCPCGGVALRLETVGGSALSGLWESSEIPPLPFPLIAGAADLLVVAGLWAPVWVCSVDLGDGVAVDMAEIGEDAAELPCAWGVEGRAAGWILLIFLWVSGMADAVDVAPSDGPSVSSEPFPPASRADSLGLSALRLDFSPPSATLPASTECKWLPSPSAWAVLLSADGSGEGALPSEPPLPGDVAAVLLSLVAPGAAPPEVEVWGREGGDERWLWACCDGDGTSVECPTWLLGCVGVGVMVVLGVWVREMVPSLVESAPGGVDSFWSP